MPDAGDRVPVLDLWGDALPFQDTRDYGQEIPGNVFHYRNGEVTSAPDYVWLRDCPGQDGCIWRWPPGESHQSYPIEVYKTYSIFRRWRHSPIFWVGSDISVHGIDPDLADPSRCFISLRFSSRSAGVSQVDYRGGERYVAGREPSWIASLVPPQYSNPFPDAPRSQGLQGELPVILGLMALSVDQTFQPPSQWVRKHWRPGAQTNQGRFHPELIGTLLLKRLLTFLRRPNPWPPRFTPRGSCTGSI